MLALFFGLLGILLMRTALVARRRGVAEPDECDPIIRRQSPIRFRLFLLVQFLWGLLALLVGIALAAATLWWN